MNIKTLASCTAVAFVIWWIILEPQNASRLAGDIGRFFQTAATGLSHFIGSI